MIFATTSLIQEQPRQSGLLGVEKVTLLYTLLTSIVIAVKWNVIYTPGNLLLGRVFVIAGLFACVAIYRRYSCRATLFLRYMYPFALLNFWYPDTYELCQVFGNLDHVFAAIEQELFGCQPALCFSEIYSSKIWSELFHLGYFAYYPMIAITVIEPLFTDRTRFGRTAFIVMASFFLYYIIYVFLPVTGPQFYFKAIGLEAVQNGTFEMVGDYFRTHTDMLASPGPEGTFRQLVEMAQASGERPTAAFPSSHVGISTILMILLARNNRNILWCLLPLYLLLCGATVYIQAHYLIDVFGGLITAVLFYALTNWLYPRMEKIRF